MNGKSISHFSTVTGARPTKEEAFYRYYEGDDLIPLIQFIRALGNPAQMQR